MPFVRPSYIQPPPGSQLDREHPLAKQMIFCCIANQGLTGLNDNVLNVNHTSYAINLVDRSHSLFPNTINGSDNFPFYPVGYFSTPIGVALNQAIWSRNDSSLLQNIALSDTFHPVSVACAFYVNQTIASDLNPISAIAQISVGANEFFTQISGSSASFYNFSTLSKAYIAVVTFDGVTATTYYKQLYPSIDVLSIDGVLGCTINQTSTYQYRLGDQNAGATTNPQLVTSFAYVWSRSLLQGEVLNLIAHPYQMILPRSVHRWAGIYAKFVKPGASLNFI